MRNKTLLLKPAVVLAFFFLPVLFFQLRAQDNKSPAGPTFLLGEKPALRFVARVGTVISKTDHSTALYFRPAAGIQVANRLFIGAAFDLPVNEQWVKDAAYLPVKDESAFWEINRGGMLADYSFAHNRAISAGVQVFTGIGTAERNFVWNSLSKQSPEYASFDKRLCGKGYFFFSEPSAMAELRFAPGLSLQFSLGYRHVFFRKDTYVPGMTDRKFSGITGGLTLQFSPASAIRIN